MLHRQALRMRYCIETASNIHVIPIDYPARGFPERHVAAQNNKFVVPA